MVASKSETVIPFLFIDNARNFVDSGRNFEAEVLAAIESSVEYSNSCCCCCCTPSVSIVELGFDDDDDDKEEEEEGGEDIVLPRLTRDKSESKSSCPSFSAADVVLLPLLLLLP